MNSKEIITYLGEKEGRNLKIGREIGDINQELPYFCIKKDSSKYVINGYNYADHDNAPRMEFIINYMNQFVIPNVSKELDLSGYYNIELHDSNSYLNNGKDYKNCLVWCKNRSDKDVVLLPDLYHLTGFGGKLQTVDPQAWVAKSNKVAFFGTTTGNRSPDLNKRLLYCRERLNGYENACDFFITNVAQMTEEAIKNCYKDKWIYMKHPYVDHTTTYNYKFNLDIPGNTASWDRVPLVLHSKSLLFKSPCTDMAFYYPLLQESVHYVAVDDLKSIVNKQTYYLNNHKEVELLVNNANKFTKDFLNPNDALRYTIALFESSIYLHSK